MARRFTYLDGRYSLDSSMSVLHAIPELDMPSLRTDTSGDFITPVVPSFSVKTSVPVLAASPVFAAAPEGPYYTPPQASLNLFTLDGAIGTVFEGIVFGDEAGGAVSSAGDFNGDGFDDFLIGARLADVNGGRSGQTYLVFGTAAGYGASFSLANLNGVNGFALNGIATNDAAGQTVTAIGDFNNDGFDDIMIGAPAITNPSGVGAVYIVFGTDSAFGSNFELSSLDGTNGFVINGLGTSENIGGTFDGAGDINGDGFEDFILGAASFNTNGMCYVVFGTDVAMGVSFDLTSLDGTNGFSIEGISGSAVIGIAVSSAGDMNGDGFDDIIVAAPGADTVYVVMGASGGFIPALDLSSLDGNNGFNIIAPITNESRVSNLGDVNGDGFDDVIISSIFLDSNGKNATGVSYVVYGSGTGFPVNFDVHILNGLNGFTINGVDAGDFSGESVSGAGDVNGDGFADILIGANNGDARGVTNSGEAYVLFGGVNGFPSIVNLDNLDSNSGFVINGLLVGAQSGNAVSSAGDVNNDGFDDLLIGAFQTNANGNNDSGAAYLIYGSATIGQAPDLAAGTIEAGALDGANGFRIAGLTGNDELGYSVSSAGDINNDGLDDFIIGAPSAGGDGLGRAYIVFGNLSSMVATDFDLGTLDGTNGFFIEDASLGGAFGSSVSGLGDINGDGIDDFIVGDSFATDGISMNTGAAYVVFGSNTPFSANIDISSLDGTNGFRISSALTSEQLGHSVANAGDVNGDGIDDIIVGAPGDLETGVNGSAYIIFGSSAPFAANIDVQSLDGIDGYVLSGFQVDDTGVSVTGIGDFNNDGIDDVLIGAPGSGAFGQGLSYVVFGTAVIQSASGVILTTLNGTDGFSISGVVGGDQSGISVSGIGDVNGDGIADLMIGAESVDTPLDNNGAAYVVFGSATLFAANFDLSTLDGTNGFTIAGAANGDFAGTSVSGVGDFNGDGFADMVIGAPDSDYQGLNDSGAAYLIFGTDQGFAANIDLNNLNGTNGLVLHGINQNDSAGRSVSGAGDINGDGFDDLIVGASRADAGGENSGQAYIIYGFAEAANAEPSPRDDDLVLTEDTISLTANVFADNGNGADTDADGDTLTIIEVNGVSTNVGSSVAGSSGGSFTINANGSVTFVTGVSFNDLAVGEHRDTSVTYTVSDGNGGTATATALVRVDGVNDAVFLFDPSNSGTPLDPANYIPAQSVIDGAAVTDLDLSPFFDDDDSSDTVTITVAIADLPPGMLYNLATNTITGTPTANASQGGPNNDGIYTILVTATDSAGAQVSTNVTYTVSNTIPVAQSDVLNVQSADNVANLFDNNGAGADTDADGDTLLITNIDGVVVVPGDNVVLGSGLRVSYLSDGRVAFFHTDLAVGGTITDSFDYTVSDGEGGMDTVSVTVTFVQNTVEYRVADGVASSLISGAGSARIGGAVSDLGDVNGDGFADILIGTAFASPNGVAVAGQSYVVFGSATGIANVDVTTLDGTNGFTITGTNIGDRIGYSVSSAGDVNGDGINDIIVGARSAGAGGQTYVIYGTNTGFDAELAVTDIDGTNGFIVNGQNIGDFSGASVSGIGDINGDGFDDILIGAPGFDDSGFDRGASYVVFGGNAISAVIEVTALDGTNGFVLDGAIFASNSGVSVSGVGDINGDGIADFIIGAYRADTNGFSEAGQSYVVFGHDAATPFAPSLDLATLDGTNGFSLSGINTDDLSGLSVSGAGDVNGDGMDDLLIGASFADPHGSNSGETYVVFGNDQGFSANLDLATLDGTNGFAITGRFAESLSGASVSNAGDFNGDGFADIIIGAYETNRDGSSDIGETYLVYGSADGFDAVLNIADLDGTNGFFILGLDALDAQGVSVSSAGDLNGDGFDDLIIGADRADNLSGEVYIIYGFATDTVPVANDDAIAASADGATMGSVFGDNGNGPDRDLDGDTFTVTSVNGVTTNLGELVDGGNGGQFIIDSNGDLTFNPNGDFDDLVGGATRTSSVTYEITDADGNTDTATVTITVTGQNHDPSAQDDEFATSVTASISGGVFADNGNGTDTDFDGDALTVSNVNASVSNVGFAVTGDNGGLFTINTNGSYTFDPNGDYAGLEPGDSSETSVNYTVSDGNGGVSNATVTVTVTAPHLADAVNDSIATDTADNIMNVFLDNGNGADVDSAGNGLTLTMINGVGVAIGDTITLTSGAVIEYLGGGNIAIEADSFGLFTDTFTYTVSNGLGQIDTAAVVSTFANNQFFLTDLDGTNGFTLLSGNPGDEVGFSVSDAGDLNNDGFDDILIGAHFANPNGQDDAGQTFVVFGSGNGFTANLDLNTLNGTNGFVLNGIAAYDNSGWSVSSAGDVNGDGIDDILIGAQLSDPNRVAQSGQTYVVFGSDSGFSASLDLASLNGTNGFTINGIDLNDQSGLSVSGIGDVNGDGVDDILIGARAADPLGNNLSGESYVIFGSASGFASEFEISDMTAVQGVTINGVGVGDQSGYSVSGAGDVNGDGIADLIVGAYLSDANGTDSGSAYIVFGSDGFGTSLDLSSLDGKAGFTINGTRAGDQFGVSVSSAGDINGDDIDDLIIGARFTNSSGNESGTSYVVFGSAAGFSTNFDLLSLDGTNGFAVFGAEADDQSGMTVANVGDFNGDGFDDILIGAAGADPQGNSDAGESYLIFGRASGFDADLDLAGLDGENGFIISGIGENNRSGFSVSGAGDVNGDGLADLIVGAPGAGDSYLIFGVSNLVVVVNPAESLSNTADNFYGTSFADIVYGLGGNDELDGFGGDDQVFGDNGADVLRGAQGNDILFGGADADIFVFANDGGTDVILDFEAGVDRIAINQSALTSYADIQAAMTDIGADMMIDFGGNHGSVLLRGVNMSDLDMSDFLLNGVNVRTILPAVDKTEIVPVMPIMEDLTSPDGKDSDLIVSEVLASKNAPTEDVSEDLPVEELLAQLWVADDAGDPYLPLHNITSWFGFLGQQGWGIEVGTADYDFFLA